MVRSENAMDDGIKLPRSGFLQVAWTDGGAKQELNFDGVMSTTLNLEKPDLQGFQEMGSIQNLKKPRFLCLHGRGSNAEKLKQELEVWPESVTGKIDLVFIIAPFPIDDGTTVCENFRWYSGEKSIGMVRSEYAADDDVIKLPTSVMSTTLSLERPGFQATRSVYSDVKKPRILCLHGHGTNAEFLKQELEVWPEFVTSKMDLVFINAPFPLDDTGEHFTWYTENKVNTEYEDFEDAIAYIEDRMIKLGPVDGVLGFSQGAIVSGALPGLQEQGLCLNKVGKIEHIVLISGAKLGEMFFLRPKIAETAYDFPINIPSLHIYGEHDIAKNSAPNLTKVYVDPLVIYHHGGHEVPKLDEEGLKIMFEFLKKINATI